MNPTYRLFVLALAILSFFVTVAFARPVDAKPRGVRCTQTACYFPAKRAIAPKSIKFTIEAVRDHQVLLPAKVQHEIPAPADATIATGE